MTAQLKPIDSDKKGNMDRQKALEAALAQIDRAFGKGSAMKLGSRDKMEIEAVSTGSLGLDIALGIGGLPRGRIIEIYGPESSGKTTLALHAIAEAQKIGGTAAFVDAEHALDPVYARKLGVDIDELIVSQPDTGEQALEIVDTLVRSNAVDVLVVDSVAALVPRAEIEGEMGDSHVGLQARLMSQALRKLTGSISRSRCTVIFINQVRMKIGVMYGNPETTTGGNALKFYASVRLDIRRTGQIKDRDDIVGNTTRVKVVKNKVAPPFKQVEFDIMYGEGINDPTLMFTNAGMVQFKNLSSPGVEKRAYYKRAATSQKCVRAGGKHNDLDNVGYTARHHTFFEMLGNFSFGDYFKEQAIEPAWNLLTKDFGLPKDKLLVTVYHTDDEAAISGRRSRACRRPDHPHPDQRQFLAMGDTGPCGPCSEIFYDHGDNLGRPARQRPRRTATGSSRSGTSSSCSSSSSNDGSAHRLPKPSIDTGMGLERIARAAAGQARQLRHRPDQAADRGVGDATSARSRRPGKAIHRVIADHLRSTSLPDRRRRAALERGPRLCAAPHHAPRHAPRPHAGRARSGDAQAGAGAGARDGRCGLSRTAAARQVWALIEETLRLYEEGRAARKGARGRCAGLRRGDGGTKGQGPRRLVRHRRAAGDAKIWFEIAEEHGVTEFLGYDTETAEGKITALLRDGAAIGQAAMGETVQIVVNQTPFYAESGGQVGDAGLIRTDTGLAEVTDT
jgi:recombination protein RecA